MYIIGRIILLVVGLIIFIIILVLLFGGHGQKKKPSNPTTTQPAMTLPDYANTTATVSMTTDGIINGDDLHRAIRIIVSNTTRELDIYQGYSGHVLNFQT